MSRLARETGTKISFNTQMLRESLGRKPFDIKIDNNKKEPKLSKNVRYTDKQNYRRYKTLTEPKLLSKIMVEPQDSETLGLEQKLMKLMGSYKEPELQEYEKELKSKLALQNAGVFTAENPFVEPPNPKEVKLYNKDDYINLKSKDLASSALENALSEIDEDNIQGFPLGGEDGTNLISDVSTGENELLTGQVSAEYLKAKNSIDDEQLRLASNQLQQVLIRKIDMYNFKTNLAKKKFIENIGLLGRYDETSGEIVSPYTQRVYPERTKSLMSDATTQSPVAKHTRSKEEDKSKRAPRGSKSFTVPAEGRSLDLR